MSAWISSWRASLRMARREVLKHRARNALIVAMLALPVFGAVSLDTIAHSSQRSTAEKLTRDLGQASALAEDVGGPIYQTPDGGNSFGASQDGTGSSTGVGSGDLAAAIAKALPDAKVLPYVSGFGTRIRTPEGYLYLDAAQLDLTDPATTGMFDLRSGRWPLTPDEILLSSAAQQQLGTKVGTSVTVPGRSGSFIVVGIADDPNALNAVTVYGLPDSLAVQPSGVTRWLIVNPGGVSWNAVKQLNAAGLLVISRAVVADPPPRSEVPYYTDPTVQATIGVSGGLVARDAATQAAIAAVVVGLVLLEVVLLAGPAFAVSARRRQREYAMIGAAGADSRDLRRMVLADGLVLGALAGLAGAVLGIGAAAATMPFMYKLTNVVPGAFQIKPLEVLAAAVLSVLLGLAAALMPARAVARQDILLSLTGRRAPARPQWKLPVGGMVLIGLGALGIYAGPHEQNLSLGALILVLGVALLEIGAIMCTPVLVGALARFGRVLPLGPRLALRDGARHRGRTTPAVAAMFAAVAGAVAAGTWIVNAEAQQRSHYQPILLGNQIAVPVGDDKVAAGLDKALRAVLPVTGSFTTHNANQPVAGADPKAFRLVQLMQPCSDLVLGSAYPVNSTAGLCGTGDFSSAAEGPQIGDGALLTRITGISDPAAGRMLSQGGVVVFDPNVIHDGKVTFQTMQTTVASDGTSSGGTVTGMVSGGGPPAASQSDQGSGPSSTSTVQLPAVYLDPHGAPDPEYVASPAAAQRLGLSVGREMLVLDLAQHPSALQLQHANQALVQQGVEDGVISEPGFQSRLGALNLVILAVAVLIAMGAAGLATGLSITDGQPDLETLSAVGGAPATRRMLAGSTALIITGLGALVGIPIGFAIVGGLLQLKSLGVVGGYVGVFGAQHTTPFVVPWLNIAVAVVGVPLVTALGAMALTRSQIRLSRRIT